MRSGSAVRVTVNRRRASLVRRVGRRPELNVHLGVVVVPYAHRGRLGLRALRHPVGQRPEAQLHVTDSSSSSTSSCVALNVNVFEVWPVLNVTLDDGEVCRGCAVLPRSGEGNGDRALRVGAQGDRNRRRAALVRRVGGLAELNVYVGVIIVPDGDRRRLVVASGLDRAGQRSRSRG